jgi:hypothetical protein
LQQPKANANDKISEHNNFQPTLAFQNLYYL